MRLRSVSVQRERSQQHWTTSQRLEGLTTYEQLTVQVVWQDGAAGGGRTCEAKSGPARRPDDKIKTVKV